MATTYIFAIGGTGARILRPMTMLLAAGAAGTKSTDEIVPIIIDYDVTNGDSERTQKLMENYVRIQTEIQQRGTPDCQEKFFSMPLVKIKDKRTQNRFGGGYQFNPRSRFEIYLDENSTNISFSEYLGYDSLGTGTGTLPTRYLIESLYDTSEEDSPRAELNLNLEKGFKGCPNIGCIVTSEIETKPEYRNFVQNYNIQNDKILIIGSVFGGTGASGIPMLLDLIRSNPNWAKGNVPVGIIAMLPYFTVTDDPNSAINSDTFRAKTKAAISAYELPGSVNSQADAIYYIADGDMTHPLANHEGGKEQENNALFPELAAAMCALTYIGTPKPNLVSPNLATAYEFGMTDNAPISVTDGGTTTIETPAFLMEHFFAGADNNRIKTPFIDPLTKLVIFGKFCKEYLCDRSKWQRNDTWLVNSGLNNLTQFHEDLGDFAEQLFGWLEEMSGPQRPLYLYHPEEKWENFYHGITLETGRVFMDPLFDAETISTQLGKEFESTKNSDFAQFVAFLFRENAQAACDKMLAKVESFINKK